MKTYVKTTGVAFGLLVLAHVWRAVVEGPRVATDPVFVVFTLLAAAMSFWAWRLVRIS